MKLILFGGSFNPIHNGHINMACMALDELKYDKLIFMPAFISPFKRVESLYNSCPAIDRLNMVKLAVPKDEHFEVSTYEIYKHKTSFTIGTVRYLYTLYEKMGIPIEGKIALLIGSDNLKDIKKWKEYEELCKLCDFVVAKRGEAIIEDTDVPYTLLSKNIEPISSTSLRDAIKNDSEWKSLVCKRVKDYIKENFLYNYPFKDMEKVIFSLTNYARENLSEKRFAHSVRVAETAEHLSIVYPSLAVLPRLAYMAGISHDITKERSDEWQKNTIKAHHGHIDDIESQNLRLLHGRTAAIILKDKFHLYNRSLLDAVKWHTFSHPYLDNLGKMLYIADKIEPCRKGMEEVREMVGSCSLNSIMCHLLQDGEKKLKEKGSSPHPYAQRLLSQLLREEAL